VRTGCRRVLAQRRMGGNDLDAFIDEFFVLLGVLQVPDGLLKAEASLRGSGSLKNSGSLSVSGKEGKASKKSSLKADVRRLSEAVAMHVYVYFKGLPNWAEIFYKRMLKYKTLLSQQEVERWIDALSVYQKLVKNKRKKSPVCVEMTESLLDFLIEHVHDPDNSLIGLTPREQVFSSHYERTADGKRFRLQRREAGDRGPDAEFLRTRAANRLAKRRSTFGLRSSGSPGQVAGRKRSLGGQAAPSAEPQGDLFRPGQLAIWFPQSLFIPESAVYCRVAGQYNGESGTVAVHDDPCEEQVRVANVADLLAFHEDMVGFLGHTRTMQNLVADPVDELFAAITHAVKRMTEEFLTADNAIDVVELNKVLGGTPTIFELPLLTSAHMALSVLVDDPPTAFYDKVDAYGKEEVEKFRQKGLALFEPTRDDAHQQLAAMQFHALASSRIQRFRGDCASALDGLSIEKKLLMNGTKKNELSNWWLGVIERATDSFLTSISFDHKAVPEDYIERRPDNLEPIRANLELISAVLNKEEDKYNVMKVVNNLKEEIYGRIREFTKKARIVLSQEFSVPLEDLTMERAAKEFEAKRADLDDVVAKWIDGMIKDIEYLEEMEEMEKLQGQKAGGGSGGLVLSNVVPVSGLILSRFFRKENEIRTVLELYDTPAARKAAELAKAAAEAEE